MGEKLRIGGVVGVEVGDAFLGWEIEEMAEGEFYLLIAFGRHSGPGGWCSEGKTNARQGVSRPRNLRQCPGTFVQFRVH
jgi:hypothetical protein